MVKKTTQIKKLMNLYRQVLEKHDIRPTKFILYGSYAHGKPTPWSDIDVVVIAKTFGKRGALERMEFLAKKAAEVDDSIEVLGYTEDELARAHDSIFGEIISKGEVLKV